MLASTRVVLVDIQSREITLKLVYYGPALSGKTTNLRALHNMMGAYAASDLVTLDTKDDRTLFFDLLPLECALAGDIRVKVKLFTVPGQVFHDATRKVVLQGVDGVAFVADSQLTQTRANNESFGNLRRNLEANAIPYDRVAVVIQFNKRDLEGIRSDAEVDRLAEKGSEPVYKAVALAHKGVAETFLGLLESTWNGLEQRYALHDHYGIDVGDVVAAFATRLPACEATTIVKAP